MKISKLVILLMILPLMFIIVHADTITATLQNQNPNPVAPGNFVYLNVKLANSGDSDIKDVRIKFIETEDFRIPSDSPEEIEAGTIVAHGGYKGSEDYYEIARFRIYVDEDTPIGTNKVRFEVRSDELGEVITFEFDLLVQDDNPFLEVSNFDIDTIEPGTSKYLNITLKNNNNIPLKKIVLSLDLESVTDDAISVDQGSNQKVVTLLKEGESKDVLFKIIASPDADAQPYLVPLDIEYEDSIGNSYTSEVLGTIKVYSQPELSVKLDSQTIYSTGTGKITLAIANPGTSSIKGTQLEILSNDDYSVVEGDYHYVGDLNPDDFQTIQSDIYINNKDNAILKVKTTYLDSYNNKNEEILEIPLKIYSSSELKALGLSGGSTFSWVSILVFIGLFVGAYYIAKKVFHKKVKLRLKR